MYHFQGAAEKGVSSVLVDDFGDSAVVSVDSKGFSPLYTTIKRVRRVAYTLSTKFTHCLAY